MSARISALFVYRNSDALSALQGELEQQGVHVVHVPSRAQARRQLDRANPAPLVFTDTCLPDGTWADILGLAGKAALAVNVIVVAGAVNTRLYVEAIEGGAFDFVAAPFDAEDVAYVTRCAWDNALARRTATRQAVHAVEPGLFAGARRVSAGVLGN